MKHLSHHHHFDSSRIPAEDHVSRLEAYVVELLRNSQIADSDRDSSINWELKHQAGVTQFGRLLASYRGLDPRIAAAGALLHDIATITTGSYLDHARAGGPICETILREVGGFSDTEISTIRRIVIHHSEKHLRTADEWIEFGKDVDILDCFLYPGAIDEYLLTKPVPVVFHYLARAKQVWSEIGLVPPIQFNQLDCYEDGWLKNSAVIAGRCTSALAERVARISHPDPAVLVSRGLRDVTILTHRELAPEDLDSIRSAEAGTDDAVYAMAVWPLVDAYSSVADARQLIEQFAVEVEKL